MPIGWCGVPIERATNLMTSTGRCCAKNRRPHELPAAHDEVALSGRAQLRDNIQPDHQNDLGPVVPFFTRG